MASPGASPNDSTAKKQENTNPNSIPKKKNNKPPIDAAEAHALYEEISELTTTYRNTIVGINNGCSYLHEEIEPLMTQLPSTATCLYLGEEGASLLGSLKTLAEKIFKEKDTYKHLEKNLGKAVFDMGRSSQQLEIMAATLGHNVDNLQSIMEYCSSFYDECSIERSSTLQENNSGNSSNASSDMSSFKSTDIITSSPLNSFNRINEDSD